MRAKRQFRYTESHTAFEAACREAFRFLVERFGFAEPEVERLGHESIVKFHKGARTVSIAYEPGPGPIVELFYPACDTGEAPTPWAERDGVPYARRIPRLQVSERDLAKQLELSARRLEETEAEFL
jgi:hypothetical protein